jgi:hypothetical protein
LAASTFPHLSISKNIRDLMTFIANCREPACAVTQNHPFYPVPEVMYGKQACRPVVPTNLATHKVMIIGEYPNSRFATVKQSDSNRLEKFVPVGDINEPFEGGRYYDGYSIRDYPTFESLDQNYLVPLNLKVREHVWLTNINKCYLLRSDHIENYQQIGWTEPPVQASYVNDSDYFKIAAICVPRHLPKELQECQPKLIIALGKKAYQMIHSSDDFQTPGPNIVFKRIAGSILRANDTSHPLDHRNALFRAYNVVHLFHPSFFPRGANQDVLDLHLHTHIPAVKQFIDDNHIV